MNRLPFFLVILLTMADIPPDLRAFQQTASQGKSTAISADDDGDDLTARVNPFIGTDGTGNTFPGPACHSA